jgi:hypothetical protein
MFASAKTTNPICHYSHRAPHPFFVSVLGLGVSTSHRPCGHSLCNTHGTGIFLNKGEWQIGRCGHFNGLDSAASANAASANGNNLL